MDPFCDNPICRCHVDCGVSEGPLQLKYVEANGNEVTTNRTSISVAQLDGPSKKFNLCDTCLSAVVMVNSPE